MILYPAQVKRKLANAFPSWDRGMRQGLISVIVPVYNAEATLSTCINSILLQSYSDAEIILVDDGSTDASLKICREFAANEKNIRLVSQENAGPSAARNNGIEHANGEYVAFVDSDDRINPRMLEKLVEPLNGGASLSCCGVEKSTDGDAMSSPICGHNTVVDSKAYLEDMLLGSLAGYAWNRLYPRNLIGETRFPVDLRFAEDLIFNCELWQKVNRVAYVSDCLYIYEQRSGSLTNSTDAYIVNEKWVFSLLTPRIKAVLPDDPWIREILSYRSASRALDGIRLLSGDKRHAVIRAELVEEFRSSADVYWRNQESLVKKLFAWLTLALPESAIRLGMSLLDRK